MGKHSVELMRSEKKMGTKRLLSIMRYLLGLLLLEISVASLAMDSLLLTQGPQLVADQYLTLAEGLKLNCLDRTFKDQKGRLWINPCRDEARDLRLSFFQYDGQKSFLHKLRPAGLPPDAMTPVWYVHGEATDGSLFGADIDNSMLFLWHPDSEEASYFSLDERTRLLNMAVHSTEGVLVLTAEMSDENSLAKETYRISHLSHGQLEKISAIQLDFSDDIIPHEPGDFAHPFVVVDGAAWFLHQRKGLVELNLETRLIQFLPWSEFEDMPPILKLYFDQPKTSEVPEGNPFSFQWRMTVLNSQELLLFLGMQNGFFTLDLKTRELQSRVDLNRHFLAKRNTTDSLGLNRVIPKAPYGGWMTRVYLEHDHNDNLLIVTSSHEPWQRQTSKDSLTAVLIDSQGSWVDYGEVILKMDQNATVDFSSPGGFFGTDFRFELGSTAMPNGMQIAILRPNLKIETMTLARYDMTALRELDTALLVNNDLQVLRSSKLPGTKKPWKRLTDWWHLTIRKKSSIVKKGDRIWMSALYYRRPRTGLQWYEPATNRTNHMPTDIEFEKFLFINDHEVLLFEDRLDHSLAGDLHVFDTVAKSSRPWPEAESPISIKSKVNDLLLSDDDILWVGAQNGLWRVDLLKQDVQQLPKLRDQNILHVYQQNNSTLWLATSESGLLILDSNTREMIQITEADGLSNNTVLGVVPDKANNLWAATMFGITVLDASGRVLFDLHERDGLHTNMFNPQSFLQLDDGRLVFGGLGGLSFLQPQDVVDVLAKGTTGKIYLTGIDYADQVLDKPWQIRKAQVEGAVLVPAEDNFLRLDFAMSNYVAFSSHSYAWRLLPKDPSREEILSTPWISLGAESQLTLTNLPAGAHQVQVRGTTPLSNQAAASLTVFIEVEEFFYRQWWFPLLLALPFALVVFAWLRRNHSEKRRLQLEVARRTQEIQQDRNTIEEQAARLRELDQAKTRFFTNISHEFRTPLTVIMGMLDNIGGFHRQKALIRRSSEQILDLVNKLMDLKKLESGKMSTHFIQADVVVFLRYLLESFQSMAEEKQIALTFETHAASLMADYDPEKLQSILSNLLSNAIKYTSPGGQVTLRFEEERGADPPMYKLAVTDTGRGIPNDQLGHIFDRFYQVDEVVNKTGVGTGVGLALVQELVYLMQGQIEVESTLGKGTTFTVKLPWHQDADIVPETTSPGFGLSKVLPEGAAPTTPEAEELPTKVLSDGRKGASETASHTLLIVEDNKEVREYMSSTLAADYQIIVAEDGLQGMETAIKRVPDIIISDVMMPQMDGFTLCERLKAELKTSHIPIILLTAKADTDSKVVGLQRGADAYLAKPFHVEELKEQLKNLLKRRQRLHDRYATLRQLEPTGDIAIEQEDKFMIQIRQIILAHLQDEGFGVPALCKHMALSRTQLHNKIKSLTNRSTSQLIKAVRMQRATELLQNPELTVSQVAYEIGLDSLPYFSKLFAEEKGMSPAKYRETIKA